MAFVKQFIAAFIFTIVFCLSIELVFYGLSKIRNGTLPVRTQPETCYYTNALKYDHFVPSEFGIAPNQPITNSAENDNGDKKKLNNTQKVCFDSVDNTHFIRTPDFWTKADFGYYLPRPVTNKRAFVNLLDGTMLFDISYTIDQYNRRVVPDQTGKRSRSALFFGGSRVFGYGVEDNQTLPYFYSRYALDYHSYNYAFPARGIDATYAVIKNRHLSAEVTEPNGIAMVFYEYSDILPLIGSMHYVLNYGRFLPHLYLNSDNEFTFAESFKAIHPWKYFFYTIISKSSVVRYYGVDLPKITSKQINLYVKLLSAIRSELTAKLNISKFYVIFYPAVLSNETVLQIQSEVQRGLVREQLNYIDFGYWDFAELTHSQFFIENDMHFTPKITDAIAYHLSKYTK